VISATFRIAAWPPHAAATGDLIRCANAALMRGKREGGGHVVVYIEEKMVLKSNYYPRADLDRLARLSAATDRTEASLLREALDDLFENHRGERCTHGPVGPDLTRRGPVTGSNPHCQLGNRTSRHRHWR
jgi:hypothetical protein